jgi:hypothetical protein
MPQQHKHHQQQSNRGAPKTGPFHRPQISSEATLLMSDGEDPFLDSPGSFMGKTNSIMSMSTRSTTGDESSAPESLPHQRPVARAKKQLQLQEPEFDSPTDVVSSGAAPMRTDSDASNDSGNPSASGLTSSDRGNYTAMVRNKYFGGSASGPVGLHHSHQRQHSNFDTIEEVSRATTSMEFTEIFESFDETRADTFSPKASHSRQPNGTPPMTLYASAGQNTSNPGTPTNPYAAESAGIMSPIDAEMMGGGMDSGRNTPTSLMTSDAMAGSIASSAASSVVRNSLGSYGNPSSLLTKNQPRLYSAIGSLEQFNHGSLRILKDRMLAPSKEFARIGVAQHTTLIPLKNQRKSLLAAVSSTAAQNEDRTTPLTSNSGTIPAAVSKTTEDSKVKPKKAKKVNGEEVFGVLKKKSSHNSDPGSTSDVAPAAKSSDVRPGKAASGTESKKAKSRASKKVSYDENVNMKKKGKRKGPIEMFRPSSDAFTPRIERKSIEYRAAEARTPVQQLASPMGTLQKPNFRDALRRVAMIIHQHVVKIEGRFEGQSDTKLATDDGLFKASMRDMFNEDAYRTPTYKCNMVRIPMARPGMVYGLRKIRVAYDIPSETEIYDFGHQLFDSVKLSSECSIVCLIYVERLMEQAKVPLLACTWRPIFMCGLLLASKVWQDLSSWNIEFASVYPQFSLEAINRLELNFLRNVKWDLYISSSLYAKYYFALRALVEKQDFRQRYNRMVGGVDTVAQSEALKIQKRTEQVKEEALLQLSRSM